MSNTLRPIASLVDGFTSTLCSNLDTFLRVIAQERGYALTSSLPLES